MLKSSAMFNIYQFEKQAKQDPVLQDKWVPKVPQPKVTKRNRNSSK